VGYGNYYANQNDFYSVAYTDSAYRPYLELDLAGQVGDPQAMPEPSALALLVAGLGAVAAIRALRA
jgi:hypothetical protein